MIRAQIQEGSAASYSVGWCLRVDLFSCIGPSRAVIFERCHAFQCQSAKHQCQHNACDVDGAWFESGECNGNQPGNSHRPQIAAIEHEGVLNPDGCKLGNEPKQWEQEKKSHRCECVSLAQDHPHGREKQCYITCGTQQMQPRTKAQWKGWTKVYRHPLHVRDEPQKSVGKEKCCFVENAQRVNMGSDARAHGFQLLHQSHRAGVKHFAY